MPAIEWGEGDVRDAMSYFDAAPEEWQGHALRGQRGPVVVYAYWLPRAREHMGSVFADIGNGKRGEYFSDPIEAIAFALSLAGSPPLADEAITFTTWR